MLELFSPERRDFWDIQWQATTNVSISLVPAVSFVVEFGGVFGKGVREAFIMLVVRMWLRTSTGQPPPI